MNTIRTMTMGALAVGALLATSAIAPASARHWHGHGYSHWRPYHHHWRPPVVVYAPRPYYYRPAPPVVYAPPVYYAPPPVYYAPRPYYAPGVSVGIGFNLR
ncbi:MAG TPA: hypothetical protein VL154_05315 [Acetobacteraceae bacterium]|jgi:hypothetical protein|nr:hypothetical protein [Acetobacteraceae bacterium]